MYVDSTPDTARRPVKTPRLRGAHRPRPLTAAARRTRLADMIVSQWLLEQVPADHRHVARGAAAGRR
jgi:hypothetical protein